MKHCKYQFLFPLIIGLSLVSLPAHAAEHSSTTCLTNAFFAFDNGVGREQRWLPAQQAATLESLGYDGIGYTGTENFAERQKAFRDRGLRIFSLYVPCYVGRPVAFDPQFKESIRQLKGSEVILWLTVQGKSTNDAEAVRIVREIADDAQSSSLRVALYPHKGFFVGTAEEALGILRKVDRPNVGVTVNLCHELAAGNADRMEAIVRTCAPHLMLVSINGADRSGGWAELIRPLGEGNYDMAGFLRLLGQVGYTGPIGLQCYNLKGDPTENLRLSIAVWRQLITSARQGENKQPTSTTATPR